MTQALPTDEFIDENGLRITIVRDEFGNIIGRDAVSVADA